MEVIKMQDETKQLLMIGITCTNLAMLFLVVYQILGGFVDDNVHPFSFFHPEKNDYTSKNKLNDENYRKSHKKLLIGLDCINGLRIAVMGIAIVCGFVIAISSILNNN